MKRLCGTLFFCIIPQRWAWRGVLRCCVCVVGHLPSSRATGYAWIAHKRSPFMLESVADSQLSSSTVGSQLPSALCTAQSPHLLPIAVVAGPAPLHHAQLQHICVLGLQWHPVTPATWICDHGSLTQSLLLQPQVYGPPCQVDLAVDIYERRGEEYRVEWGERSGPESLALQLERKGIPQSESHTKPSHRTTTEPILCTVCDWGASRLDS